MTEAQKRARNKYNKKAKHLQIDFYPPDYNLYDFICSQEIGKQTFIKGLIKEAMSGGKK